MPRLTIRRERWPIAGAFTISRGSKTEADVVVVTLEKDGARGWGECVPYRHYGESVEGVLAALESRRAEIERGVAHDDIPRLLEPKAAQNAMDCALWDLDAKLAGRPVWQLLALAEPKPLVTAFTISVGPVEQMQEAAARAAERPLLKIKLGGKDDVASLRAIRRVAPRAQLIVDANEGWDPKELPSLLDICAEVGVELVEQPLPAKNDEALRDVRHVVPICADESAHGLAELTSLTGKYDAINLKLDKTGGLTTALALRRAAEERGFEIMVGCMLATSLSMAPASLLAQGAKVVDLDGPLLLAKDRVPGIRYDESLMYPAPKELWG
jgi:L-alanine-DL-glutamate epimerase-like enolase superfamily enzyme